MSKLFKPFVLPTLHITHVQVAANDEVIALGAVTPDGDIVWRADRDEFIGMYRVGMRFFAQYGGQLFEVFVEPTMLAANDEGEKIRTRADTLGFRLLKALPEFPGSQDDDEGDASE